MLLQQLTLTLILTVAVSGVVNLGQIPVDATNQFESGFWRHISTLTVGKPSRAPFSIRNGLGEHREGLRTINDLSNNAKKRQLSWNPVAPVAAAAAPAAPAEVAAVAKKFVEMKVFMGPWSEPSVEVTFDRA
jgi:hypothetical protein